MEPRLRCKRYEICGLDALDGEDWCILHSRSPKDENAFDAALAEHRKQNGDNFRYFVFPGPADFSGATFTKRVALNRAAFTKSAHFSSTSFTEWNLRGKSLKIATKTAMRQEGGDFSFSVDTNPLLCGSVLILFSTTISTDGF